MLYIFLENTKNALDNNYASRFLKKGGCCIMSVSWILFIMNVIVHNTEKKSLECVCITISKLRVCLGILICEYSALLALYHCSV